MLKCCSDQQTNALDIWTVLLFTIAQGAVELTLFDTRVDLISRPIYIEDTIESCSSSAHLSVFEVVHFNDAAS